MYDWLTHRTRATPDATALVAAAAGQTWDYAALDAAVSEVAGRLSGLGVTRGDHLGVLLESRVEYAFVVHAAMRLGVRLVPLNARLTPRELARNVDRADLTALVCGEATEGAAVEAVEAAATGTDGPVVVERGDEAVTADPCPAEVPVASLDDPQWERVTALSAIEAESVDPVEWERDDPMLMLFTSGTTGEPKLVVLTMGNLLASAVASAFRLGVTPDDRWLVTLAPYHMGGLAPFYRSALYGTAVVLRESFDPGPAADDIGTYDVTGVSLVPTMLKRMLDARGTLDDSLRTVLLGGAPASRDLIRRCRDYSVPVHPTYGMTETASQVATARPAEAFEDLDTVGSPLLWTEVAVVDEDGEPVPAGDLGELVVSGPTVAAGYYGDPETTEASFGPNGLHTGDVGYRGPDGRVYVLNRKDDRILSGGENVDPGEVAAALREHPGINDASVVGIDDPEWGQRVSAMVVRSDPTLTAAAVEAHCRERLAGYKLPRLVQFVESLPRTVSGTVERETVRDRLTEASRRLLDEAAAVDPAEPVESPDADAHDADAPAVGTTDAAADDLSDVADSRGPDRAASIVAMAADEGATTAADERLRDDAGDGPGDGETRTGSGGETRDAVNDEAAIDGETGDATSDGEGEGRGTAGRDGRSDRRGDDDRSRDDADEE